MDMEFVVGLKPAGTPYRSRIRLREAGILGFSSPSSPTRKRRLRILARSPRETDANSLQERLNSWLLKTQNFLNEVTAPLVKTGLEKRSDVQNSLDTKEIEEFIAEKTINSRTTNGDLSLAAIVSIEQFSRMNGLTGKRMQQIFEALVPRAVRGDARNLVEYCCFRFLSRDSSHFHPCLKEPAFQRLIFITMLAWQNPYNEFDTSANSSGSSTQVVFQLTLKKNLVREDAFVRIAPAVSGVADRPIVHNLFKALVGNEEGISLSLWTSYIEELIRVHDGRRSYHSRKGSMLSAEQFLCVGSSRKQPVLRWENNMAWPGKITLTDNALYFEPIGLKSQKEPLRLDLAKPGSRVEKVRVGPFGSSLFDSAVAVYSGFECGVQLVESLEITNDNLAISCVSIKVGKHANCKQGLPRIQSPYFKRRCRKRKAEI
ncbi:hypothetical protein Scep_019160 [Stephania cephalantha]|uniref:Uncharacterized protein n=1 Tax=Stephania cephalantha TaxID=152367 RepID=A0AAP0NPK4_9MAGN